jgi:hypothetical protein
MNPSCVLTDQLDAYLDGDLAPEEARAFEAHADRCPACADERALAERLRAALRATPAAPCPDDVWAATLARIAREEQDRPALPAARQARMPRWRVAAMGVTFLALVAAALLLLRPAAETRRETPIATADPAPPAPPPIAPTPSDVGPSEAASPEASPAAPAPDAPSAPRRRARAPRPVPSAPETTAPPGEGIAGEGIAEALPATDSPEAAAAREGALLALALVAEANQHATASVRENVGDQLGHVSDALSLAFPE